MPRSTRRRGFALAEVIVALALLTVAVLSLAAAGGRLISLGVATNRRTIATMRMSSVVDSLRSTPCLLVTTGTDSTLGVRVDWRVVSGQKTRSLVVSATFSDHATHTLATESLIPCD